MLRVNPAVAQVVEPPVTVAKRRAGEGVTAREIGVLDLSQAVPGYPPAPALLARLADVVQRADTSDYAPGLGLAHVRSAVAAHFALAYGATGAGDITDDDVMITTGCNQAFCLAIGALCAPGDEVVLAQPYYFNHAMWLRASGVTPVTVTLEPAAGMLPTTDAIAAAITRRTRAVVLVTPNNPCGVTYPPALIEATFAIARAHGIALLLDETYKDFRATIAPPHGLFQRPDWRDTLVHVFSFSKMLSIAGYRAGSLVAAPHVVAEALKLADCQTIAAPRVAQEAVAFGLAHLDDWVAQRRVEMCARVEHLDTVMAARPGGYEVVTSGAFFAWVRHPFPSERAADVAARLATQHGLLTIPGDAFGAGQEPYLRLAFGNVDHDGIATAATRLAAAGVLE
jgi:aspartate/methionine/tyrosine aminotransferase